MIRATESAIQNVVSRITRYMNNFRPLVSGKRTGSCVLARPHSHCEDVYTFLTHFDTSIRNRSDMHRKMIGRLLLVGLVATGMPKVWAQEQEALPQNEESMPYGSTKGL